MSDEITDPDNPDTDNPSPQDTAAAPSEPEIDPLEMRMIQAGLRLLGHDIDEFSGTLDTQTTAALQQFQIDNDLSIENTNTDALLAEIRQRVREPDALENMARIAAKGDDATLIETMTLQFGLLLNDLKSVFDGDFDSLGNGGLQDFLQDLMQSFGLSSGSTSPEDEDEPVNPGAVHVEQRITERPTPTQMADAYLAKLQEDGVELTAEQADSLRVLVHEYESIEITREAAADAIRYSREQSHLDVDHLDDDIDYMNQQITLYRAQGLDEHEATIRGMQDLQAHVDVRHGVDLGSAPSSAAIMEAFVRDQAFNEEHGRLTDEQRQEIAERSPWGNEPGEQYSVLDYHTRIIAGDAYSGLARVDTQRLAREELIPAADGEPATPIADYERDPAEREQADQDYAVRNGLVSLPPVIDPTEIYAGPDDTSGTNYPDTTLPETALAAGAPSSGESEYDTVAAGAIESDLSLTTQVWPGAQAAEGVALDVRARELASGQPDPDLATDGQKLSGFGVT